MRHAEGVERLKEKKNAILESPNITYVWMLVKSESRDTPTESESRGTEILQEVSLGLSNPLYFYLTVYLIHPFRGCNAVWERIQ